MDEDKGVDLDEVVEDCEVVREEVGGVVWGEARREEEVGEGVVGLEGEMGEVGCWGFGF